MEDIAPDYDTNGFHLLQPSPSPDLPTTQPTSPPSVAGLEEALDSMRASSPFDDAQPILPDHQAKSCMRAEDHEADLLLDVADKVDREYLFDQLLDEPTHDLDYCLTDLGNNLEQDEENRDKFNPDNGLYDEDFGLTENEVQDAEVTPTRFQFTLDEEPDPEPEDVPEDKGDTQCAAFEEPDLICNAYIDVFVQKSLYGATHRVLKHQLKAACRTIAAHPDIQADDIANMAQTIITTEKRLGLNTNNLITMFTLCPACQRWYSPNTSQERIVIRVSLKTAQGYYLQYIHLHLEVDDRSLTLPIPSLHQSLGFTIY